MADRGDFEEMMNQYKSNYVQFLSTGNDAYKTAYKNAQSSLEEMIAAKQKDVETQKKDMQHFTQSYADGNKDMSEQYDKAAELRKNAQDIEDTYVAAKNRYDTYTAHSSGVTPYLDVTNGYAMVLRIGIILFLLPILFLIGYWSPQIQAAVTSSIPSIPSISELTSPKMTPALLGQG